MWMFWEKCNEMWKIVFRQRRVRMRHGAREWRTNNSFTVSLLLICPEPHARKCCVCGAVCCLHWGLRVWASWGSCEPLPAAPDRPLWLAQGDSREAQARSWVIRRLWRSSRFHEKTPGEGKKRRSMLGPCAGPSHCGTVSCPGPPSQNTKRKNTHTHTQINSVETKTAKDTLKKTKMNRGPPSSLTMR